MVSLSRTRLILTLAALALLTVSPGPLGAQGPKKANFKLVTIKTVDGVDLQGTFYPPNGTKKDATVLLLHDFDHKGGGSSHQDGWDKLATRLQDEGYSVLSFDFRGFGQSKTIDGTTFFSAKFPQNRLMKNAGLLPNGKPRETIDQKDFNSQYYRYLVNDVAAAKGYLDQRNDARDINSGNIIVIGAGQGATLGAMWVASECRTYREKVKNNLAFPMLQNDPEGKDVAAAIWLGISPKIAGTSVSTSLHGWVKTAAVDRKILTGFVYGKGDVAGDNVAKSCLKAATAKGKSETAAEKAIEDCAATGSRLTNFGDTTKFLVKAINTVMENRGNPVWSARDVAAYRSYYQFPTAGAKLCKPLGDDATTVDVNYFMSGGR